jgi:hypothetical protein
MKNSKRSATMAEAYQAVYLEEGLFGKKKAATPAKPDVNQWKAKPEDLPSYKRLQTAIADRKKLGDFINDNPWQANPADRKAITREEVGVDELISYLLDEGYSDDEESALTILEHMSEGWFEAIMEKMTDKELRQAAMDSVRKDTIAKHGEGSVLSSKISKRPRDKAKYSGNTDSETTYKKTYGKNKSFWE